MPVPASLADIVNETVVDVAYGEADVKDAMDGAAVSRVISSSAATDVLPALSMKRTETVFAPSPVGIVYALLVA